ncbi:peroxiredoxin [Chitinophaga niastensis]|uniref:Peroxiredoxin n=1 Tax=Chitinophaga niastensis TaxID=536980 RepID=A0A2P8HJZ6_CHINA|nr:TlpA disulfide reductase family protein [Chitinophaga niastensis]PSL46542.1 peroxiredoxin [Chitinophaga niastensis]
MLYSRSLSVLVMAFAFTSGITNVGYAQSAGQTFTAGASDASSDPGELPFGSQAPDFTFTTVKGKTISLANLKGKVVIINIWSTLDKESMQQQVVVNKEAEAIKDDASIVFISIARNKLEEWKQFMNKQNKNNIQHIVISNNTKDAAAIAFLKDYKVTAIPRTVIIGRKGDILCSSIPAPFDTTFPDFVKMWRLQQERIDVASHKPYWDYKVSIGDKLPADLQLVVPNGKTYTMKDLRGKVVLLEFTATWCGVCRKLMPHLENDIWKKYQPEGLLAFGIDFKEPKETVLEFAKDMNITYPLVLDTDGKIFQHFVKENGGLTKVMIIGRDGKIAFLSQQLDDAELTIMKNKLAELLHT